MIEAWSFLFVIWSTRVMADGAVLGPIRAEVSVTTQDRCEATRDLLLAAVRREDATVGPCALVAR